jgi:carbamate kinase
MENKPTLVVALGGNALLKRGEPLEADIQRRTLSWRQNYRSAHTAGA